MSISRARPQGGPPVSREELEEALAFAWENSDKSRVAACLLNDLRLALWADRRNDTPK